MNSSRRLTALSTALLLTTLSACGGGGGGGGGTPQDPTPRQQLTPLPTFLEAAQSQCTFEEGGQPVSLVDYYGTLANVTSLTCNGATLTNLDGIDLLTALQTLQLENAGLTSVAELQGNTTLRELDLSGNPIASLDTIAGLLGLTQLDLENTGLSDITLLNALTALQSLDLSGNGITDVTALNSLQNLTELDLSGNDITDPSQLAALTGLTDLNLSGNNNLPCIAVHDLDNALAGATNITVPSDCTNALFLTESSDTEQTIDISTLIEPFDRVVVANVDGLEDVAIFQSGDDLRLEANTGNGVKQLTFSGWFLGDEYQVSEFEIGSVDVFSFNQLRSAIGLGLALTEGPDTYEGTSGKDVVYGLGGNDIMAGLGGADIIIGGPGDDILSGNLLTIEGDTVTRNNANDGQADTFIFNLGDDHDTIYEREINLANRALLQFGAGISADDITLYRDGLDLIFQVNDADSVTIKDWFVSPDYRIGQIQFGEADPIDATQWVSSNELFSLSIEVRGTSASESISGSSEADIIYGLGGADIIIGGPGDDILSGNLLTIDGDTVTRNNVNDGQADTFIFNLGDDHDTIYERESSVANGALLQFGAGISADDITLYRDGLDLIFQVNDADSITIKDWFDSPDYRIGQIQFGETDPVDASQWVNSRALTIENAGLLEGTSEANILSGTDGNDIIAGLGGTDIIIGGPGDDILSGNLLNIDGDTVTRNNVNDGQADTFIFNLGDDHDTIYERESSVANGALLQFGAGISADDITLYRDGLDLIFQVNDADSITIKDWFDSPDYRIGQIQFGEADPVDASQWVNSRALTIENAGLLEGTSEANILSGTDGNDIIAGLGGADIIIGGPGDDILSGNLLTIEGDTVTRNNTSDGRVDTFIFNLDDNHDTIYERETSLAYRALLQFGAGISADSISASQSGNDLVLTISATDSITVKDWFGSINYRLGQIQFDGEEPQSAQSFVDSLLNPPIE